VDEAVTHAIVRAIAPQPDDAMVEIGPGLSALTQQLLDRVKRLTAIEIDRDLAARLRRMHAPERLHLIQADVLSVDFSRLAAPFSAPSGGAVLRIVGNLPYNISSPVLFHLLPFTLYVRDQHFMLQREVVNRMVAQPGSSDRGRLSVMLQARYDMEKLFDVDPSAFDPPPRVVSSVVRMQPLPPTRPQAQDAALFARVVARAFAQRRKMLRRALGDWAGLIDWDAAGVAETDRAENLAVAHWIALADQLWQAGVNA